LGGGFRLGLGSRPLLVRLLLQLCLALLKVRLVLGCLCLGRRLSCRPLFIRLLLHLCLALLKVRLVLGCLRLGGGHSRRPGIVGVLLNLSLSLKIRLVLGRLGRSRLLVGGGVGPRSRHQETNQHQGDNRRISHGSDLL
jgi:hypothetical protein